MDYYLGHAVRQQDGTELGTLRHLVVDPATMAVVSLVVQEARPDGHAVIVPVGVVNYALSRGLDDVYTYLDEAQFASMERFGYSRNVAGPPADVALPGRATAPEDANLPGVAPGEVPIGAATGIEAISFTPIISVTTNIPEGDVLLDESTQLVATDGDLGHLTRVRTDEQTHRIHDLFARSGLIFTHLYEVPVAWVESLATGSVQLNVDKAQVEAANRE